MSTFTTATASLQFQTSLHLGTHRTLLVEGATRSRVQWTLEQAQLWPPPALQRCSSILQVLSKAADRTQNLREAGSRDRSHSAVKQGNPVIRTLTKIKKQNSK